MTGGTSAQSNGTELSVPAATTLPLPDERPGFKVLYEPTVPEDIVNLVLVHELAGSAIRTWTHSKSNTFWPGLIHQDSARFSNLRIATFGYEADHRYIFGPRNVLGIEGIAKQLLAALDDDYRDNGNVFL